MLLCTPPADLGLTEHCRIAGVDEVGRGPLAGPVVAAAVILPKESPELAWLRESVRDSKQMAAVARDVAAVRILTTCTVGIGQVEVAEIDAINIRQAALKAMRLAVEKLPQLPAGILVDGRDVVPGVSAVQRAMIKGDDRELAIACASVVAKVTRDKLMTELARDFPAYGWDTNAGYGTAVHLNALQSHGLTAHHRRSFSPVRALLEAGAGRAA